MRLIPILDAKTSEIRTCYSPDMSGDLTRDEVAARFSGHTSGDWEIGEQLDDDDAAAWLAHRRDHLASAIPAAGEGKPIPARASVYLDAAGTVVRSQPARAVGGVR